MLLMVAVLPFPDAALPFTTTIISRQTVIGSTLTGVRPALQWCFHDSPFYNRLYHRLDVCIYNATLCTTRSTTGLITG